MTTRQVWINRVKSWLDIPIEEPHDARVTRGESFGSTQQTVAYIEQDPTSLGWLKAIAPTAKSTKAYISALFPFTSWLPNYNKVWLLGDLVAGLTVGAVVVPQSMAYAKLATLPPEYGLYSSFVGVLIYWPFATSKDITIGPVAVMSVLVGQIITRVTAEHPELSGPAIAGCLAVICGAIVFVVGIIRWGWLVELIPLHAIGAFMTGSALNIAVGQFPGLMGITGFSTRDATYLVFIRSLKHLGRTNLNAAFGLPALFLLYFIRWFCNWRAKRDPARAKLYFFISTLRTAFTILLFILISWLINRHHRSKPRVTILQTVPRGFKHMGVPTVNSEILSAIAGELPGAVIVLLIEHIAISKSFGRVNNYTISPSQELIAIGITNLIGPFFGAYPATGSFSRTAIKSKAGVRTPLAGVITAILVLLAIYALPPMFYYIPNAALAAVIIHAVGDLITPPKSLYHWWRINPFEVGIFFIGVFVSVFKTIEIGVYVTVSVTAFLFIWRIALSRGEFLGRVTVYDADAHSTSTREVYLPLDHSDGSNPSIPIETPHPGVFIFRTQQSPLYPNAGRYTDQLVWYIQQHTKRTNPQSYPKLGDRPWNLPGPRHIDPNAIISDPRPTLKAIIFDFTTVEHLDVTSAQTFQDVRAQLDRHASPETVEWHFAGVHRPWVKRALVEAGFGRIDDINRGAEGSDGVTAHKPIFSIAKVSDASDALQKIETGARQRKTSNDIEEQQDVVAAAVSRIPVYSLDRGAFHVDIPAAVASVLSRHPVKDFNDEDDSSSSKKAYPAP